MKQPEAQYDSHKGEIKMHPMKTLTIFVKEAPNKIHIFSNVNPFDRVLQLMHRIQNRTGFPPISQRLLFEGEQLNPLQKLSDYPDIGNRSVMHLYSPPPGGSCECPVVGPICVAYNPPAKKNNPFITKVIGLLKPEKIADLLPVLYPLALKRTHSLQRSV